MGELLSKFQKLQSKNHKLLLIQHFLVPKVVYIIHLRILKDI